MPDPARQAAAQPAAALDQVQLEQVALEPVAPAPVEPAAARPDRVADLRAAGHRAAGHQVAGHQVVVAVVVAANNPRAINSEIESAWPVVQWITGHAGDWDFSLCVLFQKRILSADISYPKEPTPCVH